ncbi:MAG: four helix bundle protein [Candidatus Brocadia sp. BROELEC01]|nr:four helix bundle protein [Candidatus Brocadia sapporoensis]QQR68183.1 MAG: four helix bundle protein [Candidatus Brocadia sp.]RZV59473.1 MAG: four helix bundle protein [Candidatus Brocadia sp. BROELEC01]
MYRLTKNFPGDELFSLTSETRRSSRLSYTNIAEEYKNSQCPAPFIIKISDTDRKNSETRICVDFDFYCEYLNEQARIDLLNKSTEIGILLDYIIENP